MSSPIETEIANMEYLLSLSRSSYNALLEQANKGFTLLSAVTSNPVFYNAPVVFENILQGVCDYENSVWSGAGYTITNKPDDLGNYRGSITDYRGNLKGFLLVDNITNHPSIDYAALASSNTFKIISGGSTIDYPTSDFIDQAERFGFLNRYLWADPINPSLTAYFDDPYMKFGLQYNSTSLVRVATASQDDTLFYYDKKKYLDDLV